MYSKAMSVFLFYNPYSGKHRFRSCEKTIKRVVALFEEQGLSVTASSQLPRSPQDLQIYSRIAVMGGDGTISRLLQVMPLDIPLGIIPFGSANVLAKHLAIPFNLERAVSVILAGHTKRMDVGVLGDKKFLCMAGFGFDTMAIRYADSGLKHIFGRTAYAMSALYVLLRFPLSSFEMAIHHETQTHTGYFAIVANCPLYGGKFVLSPTCFDNDGLMDIFLLKTPSRWALLKGLFRLGISSLSRDPNFVTFKVSDAQLSFKTPSCHIDAECYDSLQTATLALHTLPQRLSIIFPMALIDQHALLKDDWSLD